MQPVVTDVPENEIHLRDAELGLEAGCQSWKFAIRRARLYHPLSWYHPMNCLMAPV